jgi:nucleotide-binding universal stress UspA family protein
MRILLAVDGSAGSDAAVREVAERPWPENSEVRVIAVVETPMLFAPDFAVTPPIYYDEYVKAATLRAQVTLEDAKTALERPTTPLEVSTRLATGSPKRAILEEADSWKADLIVLGSHGYGALERFLLGSVSKAIALHAHCSVEIIRRAG